VTDPLKILLINLHGRFALCIVRFVTYFACIHLACMYFNCNAFYSLIEKIVPRQKIIKVALEIIIFIYLIYTFFNCTVRKIQISQQKYRSSRCLRMCLLRSTSDERSAPHTAQLTRVSGAVPLACARRCLWNAFSIVHAYEHNEHRYSSLSYLRQS